MAAVALPGLLAVSSPLTARADDELAKYAAEGNAVAVDGQCFIKKCALETSACANDPACLKGLSCLAKCKGGSMCSTGCFAKYGSSHLDDLLYCSVEKNDCVKVPGKASNSGFNADQRSELPATPLANYDVAQLKGTWYKVMGLDSRYDCFDCQRNTFDPQPDGSVNMEALFRVPRPTAPGFMQNEIKEVMMAPDERASNALATLQSSGKMFGLTFWENWYILGETKVGLPRPEDSGAPGVQSAYASIRGMAEGEQDALKLVFYTGHTLQGSYRGGFVYSSTPQMNPQARRAALKLIRDAGLDPNDFCLIRNTCFKRNDEAHASIRQTSPLETPLGVVQRVGRAKTGTVAEHTRRDKNLWQIEESLRQRQEEAGSQDDPWWFLGQRFFRATEQVALELSDWFEDPALLSDWLVQQQQHTLASMPFAASPFASLEPFDTFENLDTGTSMGTPSVGAGEDAAAPPVGK